VPNSAGDNDRPLLDAEGLLPAIKAVAMLLDAAHVGGVLIGAAAVGLVGQPRLTRDVDVLVMLDPALWPAFVDQAARCGFVPRITDCLKFARKSRVLLLRHEPTKVDVDISFGALPFEEETIARSTRFDIAGISIPVASPEDLIVMKAIAGRSKDYADIGLILEANPHADLRRVRYWVPQFAEALGMPEIVERLEMHLAPSQRKSPWRKPARRKPRVARKK
jgi:predicted nucleotidyltransferase